MKEQWEESEKKLLHQHIRGWYDTSEGQYVLKQLNIKIEQKLAEIFGFNALDMGVLSQSAGFLDRTRVKNAYILSYDRVKKNQNKDDQISIPHLAKTTSIRNEPAVLQAEYDFLPVVFDNIDLVVASHVLDISERPHQVLREIDRVLMPEGHCLLIGFNAFRHWRISPWARKLKGKEGIYHFYTPKRVKDWFSVLGFEILHSETLGFRASWLSSSLFERMYAVESLSAKYLPFFGSVYIIHAKKQEASMMMQRKRWSRRIIPRGNIVAVPASRSLRTDSTNED